MASKGIKKSTIIGLFIIIAWVMLLFAACNTNQTNREQSGQPDSAPAKETPTYTVPADITAVYGTKLIDINLPDGFVFQNADAYVGDVGEHVYYVTFTPEDIEKYEVVCDIPVNVYVQKAVINMDDVYFCGMQCTADGTTKSLVLDGIMPAGIVNVIYENNDRTEAGEYSVTAKFIVDENHCSVADKEAKLTIVSSPIQGISFVDKTVIYDGNAHKIEVQNLPEGATVSYQTDNEYTTAGVYNIVATVRATDGSTVDLSAKLTIRKLQLSLT